jgi:transcriptional regulator with GAF, ATPase, and Fis domain
LREQLAEAEPEIVCASEVMRCLVHETLPLVARQDVTVLVRGERGTGKELVVRRLHALSRRARRALVTVNCGALPEGVAESTLFGHESGAFTGASARHLGIFERANGGTVFLDEAGELSAASQARLLRVLSSGEVTPVGGAASHRVDVRVVAATHRPLEAMIADGRFRQDLFFRLNVVPIHVPPLRDRLEDLEPLARSILESLARRASRRAPRLRGEDLLRLRAWPWPGNVRELENLVHRAPSSRARPSSSAPRAGMRPETPTRRPRTRAPKYPRVSTMPCDGSSPPPSRPLRDASTDRPAQPRVWAFAPPPCRRSFRSSAFAADAEQSSSAHAGGE